MPDIALFRLCGKSAILVRVLCRKSSGKSDTFILTAQLYIPGMSFVGGGRDT